MKLNIYHTPVETIEKLADYFVMVCNESIANYKRFSIALSGGNSPKKLYELLASDVYKNKVDWSSIYFFFGDERYVPQADKESNYLMVKKALFQPLNIADDHIFAVNTSLGAEQAAKNYGVTILQFFKGEQINFNLVLLGLGDNAHTASLFPYTEVLHDKLPAVKAVFVDELGVYRITFNAPLINNALNIAFLVFGKDKAGAVRHILKDETNIDKYPAQLIKPANGDLQWFMDQEAATLLKTNKQ